MIKFQNWLEKHIAPIATAMSQNKAIQAVTNGMMLTIAFTIVGSLFTVILSFPVEAWTTFLVDTKLDSLFRVLITTSTDIISVIAVYGISSSLARQNGHDDRIGGFLGIVAFLIVLPLEVTVGDEVIKAISFSNLGGRGLFVAIFIGLLSGYLFSYVNEKKWVINMPEGVPQNVGNVFSGIIPILVVSLAALLIRYATSLTQYGDLNTLIYAFIQMPLMALMSNALSTVFLTLLNSVLWFFGIHSMAANQLVAPAMKALDLANLTNVQAGLAATNISTWNFFQLTAKLGGTGATFGMCVWLAFFAKSKQLRTLGKLALPAVIFNVNEPLIFGLPIMLNPLLIIPFITAPLLSYLVAFLVSTIGIVGPVSGLQIPVETPVILSGLLQGGVGFALLQVGLAFLTLLIWLPFVRIMDNNALKIETSEVESSSN